MRNFRTLFGVLLVSGCLSGSASAQFPLLGELPTPESAIVDSSTQVIQEIMTIPAKSIPGSLLANAEGIAIIPGMIKGGFVIGAKRGHGVMLTRDPGQGWQAPQFITVTGGSVGWQIGVQATDLVLVFVTKKSVQSLFNGAFTIGADASAAAGPVGREASVSTDATLKAEIYSYSRSRGLFAGVALDGSVLKIDTNASTAYYHPRQALPAGQAAQVPPSAMRLIAELTKYGKLPHDTVDPPLLGPVVDNGGDVRLTQQKLAAASQRLNGILDDSWKAYLALPAETFGSRPPAPGLLAQSLKNFQNVATSPEYSNLAQRPEFAETYHLLQQLTAPAARTTLTLPPPPR